MKFAIYFDGEVLVEDVTKALGEVGLAVVTDGAGRMNAVPVPRMVRKDPPLTNVLKMPAPKRRERA